MHPTHYSVKEPLQLGKLRGNRFEIVLREVSCEAGLVEASCRALAERGFINYYGLQRFGKGGAGNHLIGTGVSIIIIIIFIILIHYPLCIMHYACFVPSPPSFLHC
mgnify:CR=1 FL=1